LTSNYDSTQHDPCQGLAEELDGIFASIPYKDLLRALVSERVRSFSPLGRPGYSLEAMLKGILAGYYLCLKSTADIVRRLQEDSTLALFCGFNSEVPIPHRTSFSRFIKKLRKCQNLVDQCLNVMTSELKSLLPDFGKIVIVDSTPVPSYSNPNRKGKPVSDQEAGWIAKGGSGKNIQWVFGYRLHLAVDAKYELPIGKKQTLAQVQDIQMMIPLLNETKQSLQWFSPDVVMGDKGYDSHNNYEGVVKDFEADPIIPLAAKSKEPPPLVTGSPAAPYCPGGLPLIYRSWDKNQGLQYQCPEKAGKACCPMLFKCPLKIIWVRPIHDYRRFGYRVKRGTEEWKELYHQRVGVERCISRLKETRRLEDHCFRGFERINIHSTLSVLVMQAVALAKAKVGQIEQVRLCGRQID